MNDFISFIAFMLLGYLCCVGFILAMIRTFFPLKTKEEWAQMKASEAAQGIQRMSRVRTVSVNETRQLA